MIQTLSILKFNLDNKGDDKPNTNKQAISLLNCPKWREMMQVEYNSLIENETWDLKAAPDNRQLIFGR